MPLSIPAAAISVALRQSAAFLGARGLCLARHALDGSVLVLAKEGDVGDDDAITAALAAQRGALPGTGTAAWVGAAPFGTTGHVLLAFSDFPLDEGALDDATELVRALVHEQSPEITLDPVRFVGDLASDSSPLPELLDIALQRALRVLGLDAAVLLCVEAEAWDVEALCDPADILDLGALLETDGLATMTYRASGAVGLHDVPASSFAEARSVGAYLGAPIVSGRNGLGVLAFVAREPRDEPFAAEHRDLVQMLARWAGIALGAQVARRKLQASEASLRRRHPAPRCAGGVDRRGGPAGRPRGDQRERPGRSPARCRRWGPALRRAPARNAPALDRRLPPRARGGHAAAVPHGGRPARRRRAPPAGGHARAGLRARGRPPRARHLPRRRHHLAPPPAHPRTRARGAAPRAAGGRARHPLRARRGGRVHLRRRPRARPLRPPLRRPRRGVRVRAVPVPALRRASRPRGR